MSKTITFVHTADLHQAYEFSVNKWKRKIPQRSDDFLDNFILIMDRSLEEDIDFLVIAGDIFDRSKPNPIIRQIIIDKLVKLSSKKPVLLIPGNHDKSKIHKGLLFVHKNLHIYNTPTIETIDINGLNVSVTAIPFIRNNKMSVIENIIEKSPNFPSVDLKLLIMHELLESCKVGYTNFEFKKFMKDVVPIEMVDQKFDYIALGHVHKHQRIKGSKTPIYYSGSVERTSIVEREEMKGFIIVKVTYHEKNSSKEIIPTFNKLPARDIIYYKIPSLNSVSCEQLLSEIDDKVSKSKKKPLIRLNISNFDNYEKYKTIKEHLSDLKDKDLIFLFTISSPDFKTKIKKQIASTKTIAH